MEVSRAFAFSAVVIVIVVGVGTQIERQVEAVGDPIRGVKRHGNDSGGLGGRRLSSFKNSRNALSSLSPRARLLVSTHKDCHPLSIYLSPYAISILYASQYNAISICISILYVSLYLYLLL